MDEIISGQTQFTTKERNQILRIMSYLHPGQGNSMKSALRISALEYSKIDLTSDEIGSIMRQTGEDSLIVAMCQIVRGAITDAR
jgi:hypothetical protein